MFNQNSFELILTISPLLLYILSFFLTFVSDLHNRNLRPMPWNQVNTVWGVFLVFTILRAALLILRPPVDQVFMFYVFTDLVWQLTSGPSGGHIFLCLKKDMAPGGRRLSREVGKYVKQKDIATGGRRSRRATRKT